MRRRRFTWRSCLSGLITLVVFAGVFFLVRPYIAKVWLKSSLYMLQTHLDDYRRTVGYYPDTIAELQEEMNYKLPFDSIGLLYFTGIQRMQVVEVGKYKPGGVVFESHSEYTSQVDAYYLGIYGLNPNGGKDYFHGKPNWDNVYEKDEARDGKREGLILVLREPPRMAFN